MRFSLQADVAQELKSVALGYPGFVFSGKAASLTRHVPVFVYHDIDPSTFEQDLRFLADNGYRTIGMDDLVGYLNGGPVAEGAIVLTFDDARSSFWRFGYPLLERYRMKGVLFVIAGLTTDALSCRPNLLCTWEGLNTHEQITALDPDDVTLCTWPELRRMHASGHVEIESHSLFHQEVFTGNRILDFLGPDSNFAAFLTPATAYLSKGDIGRDIVPEALFGLPLFRPAPLHQGLPAWELPQELRDFAACAWNELPDDDRRSGAWRPSLRARWKEVDLARHLRRRTESDIERSITEDMATARDLIREKVAPGAGQHFCFPYSVGSRTSTMAATRLGIKSCSWGVIPGKRHNAPGNTPMKIGRIKADFVRRLPGAGQASLARIYGRKIGRRLLGGRVY